MALDHRGMVAQRTNGERAKGEREARHSKGGSNGWGAPRIHAELAKLGFHVAEATVSRDMPRRPPDRDKVQTWMTFLRNHKDAIAAMDFFTVPTIRLRVLYCFLVIGHGRRRILHFNATFNATSARAIQQLREASPFETAPRHRIFDRDAIFGAAVIAFVKAIGTKPSRTAFRSLWQNPIAERWIGSCGRELFDHVIVCGEQHAVRPVQEYVAYPHQDRTHLGLAKDTPDGWAVTPRPSGPAKVVALPRVWWIAPSVRVA